MIVSSYVWVNKIMKNNLITVVFILVFGFNSAVSHASESWMTPIKHIAEIIHHLNHLPSDNEKRDLMMIMENDGMADSVRLIARALYNINHAVNANDKPKLKAIQNDPAAMPSVRELADILYRFNHQASTQDKAQLKKMLGASAH